MSEMASVLAMLNELKQKLEARDAQLEARDALLDKLQAATVKKAGKGKEGIKANSLLQSILGKVSKDSKQDK